MSFEERAKSHFIEMMKKQNFEWQMIEAGLLEEEQEVKPIKPKKK